MYVTNLILENIRIISHCEISLSQGITAFVGDNGQGKTSILEAIYWASYSKSFRNIHDEDFISNSHNLARISLETTDGFRPQDIEVELRRIGRNSIVVNGQKLRRNRDLLGTLRVSIFTPDDLSIIKGPSTQRRGLLDDTLMQISPKYVAAYSDYIRALKQKNAYLKADRHDIKVLDVLNETLVVSGAQILAGRLAAVNRLRKILNESYKHISGEQSDISIIYSSSIFSEFAIDNYDYIESLSLDELSQLLSKNIQQKMDIEFNRRHSIVGPHRDDLLLFINNRDTRTQASQGEQRSMALALKTALHQVVYEKTGDNPVLLLDDVFSELDIGRTHRLIECLPATQTFVTTANELPSTLKVNKSFNVHKGIISS